MQELQKVCEHGVERGRNIVFWQTTHVIELAEYSTAGGHQFLGRGPGTTIGTINWLEDPLEDEDRARSKINISMSSWPGSSMAAGWLDGSVAGGGWR